MAETNENIRNFPHQLSLRVSGSGDSTNNTGGSHFDGRLLTADDLAREQGTRASAVSEGGFNLIYAGESGSMAGTGQFPYQVSLRSEPSSGDVDGDGRDDLIVGAGPAGGHVKVFDGGSADVELPDLLVTSWQNSAAAHGLNDHALITDFNTSLSSGTGDLVFG